MLIILRKTPAKIKEIRFGISTGASEKQAAIAAKVHDALSKRLTDPKGGFRSFIEIQQWLSKEFDIDMNYQAVNKYVKRKFGAQLKVSRKKPCAEIPR